MADLPVVPEWEPVLGSDLGFAEPEPDRDLIQGRAGAQGLQAVRWPDAWPPDTAVAMLAAAYAKQIGRAVAFSLAAFRQAFAGGRNLGDVETVLIAAAACEMHPTAILRAIELRSVAEALEHAGARAKGARVASLPAIQVGEQTFEGVTAVDDAAQALVEPK
jgi:2-hydroxychromene-2-carboxylate isomerase